MITIKRVNALSKEAYERYRQDPRHGAVRDRDAFCDAVKAVVVTGLVFEAARIVLGAAAETEPVSGWGVGQVTREAAS